MDGYDYILYEITDSPWKIYVFALATNSAPVIQQFDIYKFVQVAKREYDLSEDLYVSEVKTGFRLYGGAGNYTFNKV